MVSQKETKKKYKIWERQRRKTGTARTQPGNPHSKYVRIKTNSKTSSSGGGEASTSVATAAPDGAEKVTEQVPAETGGVAKDDDSGDDMDATLPYGGGGSGGGGGGGFGATPHIIGRQNAPVGRIKNRIYEQEFYAYLLRDAGSCSIGAEKTKTADSIWGVQKTHDVCL